MALLRTLFQLATVYITSRFQVKLLQEQLIFVNYQKINYLKVGNGPKSVLCTPGALGTIDLHLKPFIEGLDKNEFTIIAWDPPGHGKSRPPERVLNAKYHEEDADTAYAFMKELGVDTYSVLGWSDGGISGMIHAAKYPEVVEKLVIWGSLCYLLPSEIEAVEKEMDVTAWPKEFVAPYLEVYGEKNLKAIQEGMITALKGIEKNGGNICKHHLKNIKCPTLILHGDKDSHIDPSHPENLLKNINGSKLHRFPEAGHGIHLESTKEFLDIVTKFLLE